MGAMMWIGIGILVIGGWCFLAGPCMNIAKGVSVFGKGVSNAMNNPQFKKLVTDHNAGRITDAQFAQGSQALARTGLKQAGAFHTYY